MNLNLSEIWRYLKLKFKMSRYEHEAREFSYLKAKKNGYEFPCSDKKCLVKVSCTKPCDKIEMDDDKLKDLFIEYNVCPDCGSEAFYKGPSGGMATNVKCQGCGHWYNMGLPLFIQRIHISDGRFYD